MTQHVVIGRGPDALRVAAMLAARGEAVVLLQQAEDPAGLTRPDLAEDDGTLRLIDGSAREAAESVFGPLRPVAAPRLHVACDDQVWALPLRPDVVPRLMGAGNRRVAARSWVRARARNALAELVGGGQEERSHRDWVIRRMGLPAWEHLYEDYAQRRWGEPSHALSVNLARMSHFVVDEADRYQVAGGCDEVLQRLVEMVTAQGRIVTGADVSGLAARDGRVVAVQLATGDEVVVDGHLFVEDTAARVVAWLGESASDELRVDAGRLKSHHRLRVGIEGLAQDAGCVTHLLASSSEAWRVIATGNGRGVVECTVRDIPDDPEAFAARVVAECRSAALGQVQPDGGAVEVNEDAVAVWEVNTPAVVREVLTALGDKGIVMVGARGAFGHLCPGEAIRQFAFLLNEGGLDQQEAQRQCVQAPTRLDDLGAHITRFVTR